MQILADWQLPQQAVHKQGIEMSSAACKQSSAQAMFSFLQSLSRQFSALLWSEQIISCTGPCRRAEGVVTRVVILRS